MLTKPQWVSPPVINLAHLLLQESENAAEKMLDTLVGVASHYHCLHTTNTRNSIMYDIERERSEMVLTIQGCCRTGVEDPQPKIFCAEQHQLILFASRVRAAAAPRRWRARCCTQVQLRDSHLPAVNEASALNTESCSSSSSERGFSPEYRVLSIFQQWTRLQPWIQSPVHLPAVNEASALNTESCSTHMCVAWRRPRCLSVHKVSVLTYTYKLWYMQCDAVATFISEQGFIHEVWGGKRYV